MITTTSTALLIGLQDPRNDPVWTEFCSRYRPVLVSFARRLGLTDSDAQDAAQEALLAFVAAYREGKYDRQRGRVRSWLFGVAQRKARDIQRRNGKELVVVDRDDKTGLMKRIADEHSMSEVWEDEWRQAVVKTCLDEVRKHVEPTTMQAFELITLQQQPTDQVAAQLNMTRNAVLKANRRALSRMREMQKYLEINW